MTNALKTASWLLIALGFLSLAGFVTGLAPVRGVGFATVASPLPFVFSKFRGVENFAADFDIAVETVSGKQDSFRLTPAIYARIQGPYNRRNPYGAVIAYGPMLTSENEVKLRDGILRFGICGHGPLALELGYGAAVRRAKITFHSKTAGQERTWDFSIVCS